MTKEYFINLNGLRFFAFFLVYFQHGFSFDLINSNYYYSLLINNFFNGGTGVSIFFVLSGFLITYLLLQEKANSKKINIWYFYLRRILRIWPLYYALLIFVFFIYPITKKIVGSQEQIQINEIYYYFFLSNFDVMKIMETGTRNLAISAITWSVSIEEQFYVVWPLVFHFIQRKFYNSIFIIIILISLVFRYLNLNNPSIMYFHTLSVCSDLSIGGLIAYCCYSSFKFIGYFSRMKRGTIILIYSLGFCWFFWIKTIFFSTSLLIPFIRIIEGLLFAFVILEQNYSVNSIYKFSKNSFFSFWGRYTYGLYLIHPIALLVSENLFVRVFAFNNNDPLKIFLSGIFGLILSFLLSFLSYEYFEKYFLKLKSKFEYN